MNDEELRDYLKRFYFGREHLICSRDLVRQKNLRESDLRKKVNRLRRKAVPIASSREGYFYASNAAELYSTIRQLKEMRAGLDADCVLWSGEPLDIATQVKAVFVNGTPEYRRTR